MALTKKDLLAIGDLIREAMEKGFAKFDEEKIAPIRTDIQFMKGDINLIKTDIKNMKFDLAGLRTEIDLIKTDVRVLRNDVDDLKNNPPAQGPIKPHMRVH